MELFILIFQNQWQDLTNIKGSEWKNKIKIKTMYVVNNSHYFVIFKLFNKKSDHNKREKSFGCGIFLISI